MLWPSLKQSWQNMSWPQTFSLKSLRINIDNLSVNTIRICFICITYFHGVRRGRDRMTVGFIQSIHQAMLITAKVSVNSIYYSNTNKQKYYDMILYDYVLYKVTSSILRLWQCVTDAVLVWCSWPLGFFVLGVQNKTKIREVTSTRLLMQVGGFLRF